MQSMKPMMDFVFHHHTCFGLLNQYNDHCHFYLPLQVPKAKNVFDFVIGQASKLLTSALIRTHCFDFSQEVNYGYSVLN